MTDIAGRDEVGAMWVRAEYHQDGIDKRDREIARLTAEIDGLQQRLEDAAKVKKGAGISWAKHSAEALERLEHSLQEHHKAWAEKARDLDEQLTNTKAGLDNVRGWMDETIAQQLEQKHGIKKGEVVAVVQPYNGIRDELDLKPSEYVRPEPDTIIPLDTVTEHLARMDKQLSEMGDKVGHATQSVNQLNGTVANLQQEVDELKGGVTGLSEKAAGLRERVEHVTKETRAQAQSQIEELQGQVRHIDNQLHARTGDLQKSAAAQFDWRTKHTREASERAAAIESLDESHNILAGSLDEIAETAKRSRVDLAYVYQILKPRWWKPWTWGREL